MPKERIMLRFGIVLLGFAAAALADSANIPRDLGHSGATVRVTVQYRTAPTQADLDDIGAQGGQVRQRLSGVKALTLDHLDFADRVVYRESFVNPSGNRPYRHVVDTATGQVFRSQYDV